jgi:aminopeptidase-like protein
MPMQINMIKWIHDLFPIYRTITGLGIKKTLEYFEKINPELKRIKFKSGTKVFDWQIPNEWRIEGAFIQHVKSGKKFAEFKKNNLHVVGYSTPMNKIMDKKKLMKYLHTSKKRKNAIPYVTSYYKKNWGFCISENQIKKLPSGKYKVYINSNLHKGHLDISHALLKGKSKKEILFTSYCCHPSMANNELSGPVLMNGIMKYLKKNYKKRNYSYRFILGPETIGPIAYLSKYEGTLKKNVIAGFGLSCVGDKRGFSIIKSKKENTLADEALTAALKDKKNFYEYSFLDRGSDERQYCSPGIDLPYVGFCRSKYGTYPEYHTSDDNLSLVSQKNFENSLKVFADIIDSFESGVFPKYQVKCEPQLGKRNLYPNISKEGIYEDIKLRMNLLAYSDGHTNIFKISNLINKPLLLVLKEYKFLKKQKLLKSVFF